MALFIFYNSFRESVVQNDNGYKEIFDSKTFLVKAVKSEITTHFLTEINFTLEISSEN